MKIRPPAAVLLLSSLLAPGLAADETEAWKRFVADRAAGEEPLLPDFSYAGYRRGEAPIPEVKGPIFAVKDYGAVADDGKDDQAAIQDALDAAAAAGGGVVLFGPGRFLVNSDRNEMRSIRLAAGHVVLRGAGSGRGGTVVHMAEARQPSDPSKMYSTPFHFVLGSAEPDVDLARVTADARRETFSVEVDDASALAPGMRVALEMTSVEAAGTYLAPYEPRKAWERLFTTGVRFQEIHQVRSIDGRNVTFEEPLRAGVHAGHGWKVRTWNHVEGIGVEDLCFSGGWTGPFRHHRSALDDSGYSGLQLRKAADSWIRRCSFVGFNQAVLLSECATTSVLQVRLAGARGHCSIMVRGGGDGVLVGLVRDEAGHHHGPSVGYRSSGVVFWRYEMDPAQPIDSHSGTPIATLYDRVDGGRLRGSGGPVVGLPNHLAHLVVWNFDHRAGPATYDFWPASGRDTFVRPVLVGLHGDRVRVEERTVALNESPGRKVEPESLYEAQLALRLGSAPEWVVRARESWAALRSAPLPGD